MPSVQLTRTYARWRTSLKKGFIEIFKDPNDKRINRLRTTEVNNSHWESRAETQSREVMEMFKDFSDGEIESMHDQVLKLYNELEPTYRALKSK